MATDVKYLPLRLFGVWVIVAILAALFVANAHIESSRDVTLHKIMVIYVGADDCAPCRAWRHDRWPQFAASSDFQRLVYREVTSSKLFDLLNDDIWPEDLRRYRNTLDRSAGAPLWFIVVDDKIRLTARGLKEWDERAVPQIRMLVGRS